MSRSSDDSLQKIAKNTEKIATALEEFVELLKTIKKEHDEEKMEI